MQSLMQIGRKAMLVGLGCALYTAVSICTKLSQQGASYQYSSASVVMVAEAWKFSFSMFMLGKQNDWRKAAMFKGVTWEKNLRFAVPGLLYMITNNTTFIILEHLEPATYQILANLKILTTALLFRVVFKKRLSNVKWVALVLLLVGSMSSSNLDKLTSGSNNPDAASKLFGIFVVCVECVISGMAGVYTEYRMKDGMDDSIYLQVIFNV